MKTKLVRKKYLPILVLILFGCTRIQGQVRMALFGGIHSANVQEKNNIPGWDSSTSRYYSPRTGFNIGVLLEFPLGNKGFFLQPGLDYSSKGRQYLKYNDSATAANSDTIYNQNVLKLGYVEIPLYLTYKIPLSASRKNSFFVSAGPYFSFFYNGTMSTQNRILSTNTYNSENDDLLVGKAVDKYKTFDMGLNAKAGFEFGNIMLSAYYSQGLSNFYTAPYAGSFHHVLVGATIGIWIGKPAPAAVVEKKDSDHDGVPDDEDLCPDVPGTLARHGCPVPDTDHDGIDDDHDSCRTVPGFARYHGCPVPDSDGDGIDDEHDSCKTVPGLARYHGCPIPDSDADGVNDEEDLCPNQPGPPQNHGCPVVKQEVVDKTNYESRHVTFNSSSDQLTENSYQFLDELARDLSANASLHLSISGYTDSTGVPAHNMTLSQKRADAVKNYLVQKGIPAERITATGYGQQHPVADNRTAEGKALNRRVEFKLETTH